MLTMKQSNKYAKLLPHYLAFLIGNPVVSSSKTTPYILIGLQNLQIESVMIEILRLSGKGLISPASLVFLTAWIKTG